MTGDGYGRRSRCAAALAAARAPRAILRARSLDVCPRAQLPRRQREDAATAERLARGEVHGGARAHRRRARSHGHRRPRGSRRVRRALVRHRRAAHRRSFGWGRLRRARGTDTRRARHRLRRTRTPVRSARHGPFLTARLLANPHPKELPMRFLAYVLALDLIRNLREPLAAIRL